jgi:hypothetical protein
MGKCSRKTILKELSIGGVIDNGRVQKIAIKAVAGKNFIDGEHIDSFALDFVPHAIVFIMSIDPSLSDEEAQSLFDKMSNDNHFNGEISKNGYKYEYSMEVEKDLSATIVTILAMAGGG